MPRRRVRGKRKTVSDEEFWALMLGGATGEDCVKCEIGSICQRPCWAFETDKARRESWFAHREELFATYGDDMKRSWAYEQYELGVTK